MKVSRYQLAVQLLSRDENDGGFVADGHVIAKVTKSDLDLPFDQFVERYLRPAFMQAKTEHDRQFELVEEAFQRKHADA